MKRRKAKPPKPFGFVQGVHFTTARIGSKWVAAYHTARCQTTGVGKTQREAIRNVWNADRVLSYGIYNARREAIASMVREAQELKLP